MKWVKYGPITICLRYHIKLIFFSIIYFTAIISHGFSRIDDYVNALIIRHMAPFCRWI